MEHRSRKREHHGQPRESKDHGKSKGHGPTETTERRAYENSKRRPGHEERPKVNHAKPDFSGDDDYVRRWLAQTDQDIKSVTNRPRTQGKVAGHRDTILKPQLELRSFRQAALESDNAQLQSKGNRRHRSSSDSSLIEPVMKPELKSRKGEEPKPHKPERREEPVSKQHKKRKIVPSDSGSSADSNTRQETFEKRDRHKTREDCYEPKKKKHKSDKTDGETKPKKTREKKSDKKKESKKVCEDLMNHFSSKSIGQERLTIRPSHGPGLFKNGRASSPVQRRGLPDLVFSEMEFLQHPSRHPVSNVTSKVTSKSRDKDKRRASREHDEISIFFKPTKPPLSETSPNARKGRSSTHMSDDRSLHIKQGVVGRAQGLSQSIDFPEKQYSRFGHPSPYFDRFSASRRRTPSMQCLQTMPNTASRLSENTMGGVTWSETQISPATAASKRWSYEYASATPEAIRVSIERTGIFRDTGIGETPGFTASGTRPIPPQYSLYQNQASKGVQTALGNSDGATKRTNFEETPTNKPSERVFRRPKSASRDQTLRPAQNREFEKLEVAKESRRSPNEIPPTSKADAITRRRSQIIVEPYDPELEWHQQQGRSRLEKTTASPAMDVAPLGESKSTPTTREEIAKHARVKRPATTLPVTRVPEEPSLQGGKKTSIPAREAVSEKIGSSDSVNSTLAEKVTHPVSRKALERSIAGVVPTHHSANMAQITQSGRDTQMTFSKDTHDHSPEVYHLMQPQSGRKLDIGANREPAISINRPNLPRLESAKPEPTILTGLPARGPSRRSFGQPSRIHLTPVVGSAPLYFSQIQRQSVPEEPVFENDTENDHSGERLDTLNPEMVPYLEDIHYNMLGGQEYVKNEYAGIALDEGQGNYGYLAEDSIDAPQVWQPIGQGGDVVEQYDTWDGPEQDLGNEYEMINGTYGSQTFVGEYGLEEPGIAYEDQLAGEEISMQGFWRFHRPY